MDIQFRPEAVYLTCPAFGYQRKPLCTSTTRHIVVDLAQIVQAPNNRNKVMTAFAATEIPKTADAFATSKVNSSAENDKNEKKGARPARVEPKSGLPEGHESDQTKPNSEQEQEGQGGSSSSRDIPAPELPEPQPPPGVAADPMTLARKRMLTKLSSETELLRLHLKHYHMSVSQFKRRTSALGLPDYIFAKYEMVVKKCEACMETKPAPARSRISGIRANNFGDILFVDQKEKEYCIFLVLDVASSLLWATVVVTKEDSEAQEAVRQWMDQHQCRPKKICGDMAFHTDPWLRFFRYYNIEPIALGPRTPWPNRAETAVRLFKRQLSTLAGDALADPDFKRIKCTVAQLVKKAVWARNTTLTYSGKAPIELAFGRRPPDIIMTENASPTQLSEPEDPDQLRDVVIQRLAIKAHLEAQQMQDLRKDLARRLRPSEGPFKAGDKVFYWDQDRAKIKSGHWLRGRCCRARGSHGFHRHGKTSSSSK